MPGLSHDAIDHIQPWDLVLCFTLQLELSDVMIHELKRLNTFKFKMEYLPGIYLEFKMEFKMDLEYLEFKMDYLIHSNLKWNTYKE